MRLRTTSLAGIAIAASVFLTGCMETMPHPDRPRPPRPGRPMACTMEYAPVCAAKGWRRETFSNACMARAKRYSIVHDGACREDRER